ncbi:MAG: hypothetical protein AB1641_30795 [Thermodesulfobacteriota bacterium]
MAHQAPANQTPAGSRSQGYQISFDPRTMNLTAPARSSSTRETTTNYPGSPQPTPANPPRRNIMEGMSSADVQRMRDFARVYNAAQWSGGPGAVLNLMPAAAASRDLVQGSQGQAVPLNSVPLGNIMHAAPTAK